jgi:cobalt-zinc-cadmium efflux system membrane fusion protein
MRNDTTPESTHTTNADPTGALPEPRDTAPHDSQNVIVVRLPRNKAILVAVAGVLTVAIVLALVWSRREPPASSPGRAAEDETSGEKKAGGDEDDDEAASGEVALDPETLAALHLEVEAVTTRAAVAPLAVTGTVEANAEREQQVVSLISGSLASVNVSLGDRVGRGAVLATVRSPQIAELQGQLYEARSKLDLASANVRRVRTSANRAGVISAKAKLDLATKTLDRKTKLVELGASPRKELEEAQAEYDTAKAEYDYQSNVALSREVQEAESERDAAQATVDRLGQQLSTLGASPDGRTPLVSVTAPVSGVVRKREVNSGAGVQEGTLLFTVADTSSVWVIANVPESLVRVLRAGVPAEVRSSALGDEVRRGSVSYIDPQLDTETRTARVRVELPNAGEALKPGMFVDVTFRVYPTSEEAGEAEGEEALFIPEAAVQRTGDRAFVFVPEEDEPGHFLVKDVELGEEVDGYVRVLSGLDEDDKVVTKGAFALKSKALKGSFGEDDDE